MKSVPGNSIDLLRSVSRSLYLSIRFLPARLRDPIGLAYLLARATDTIADTAQVPVQLRIKKLRTLADAIQSRSQPNELCSLRDSFTPLQTNESERTLLEVLPACLDWLDRLEEQDRHEVQNVLAKINRGQLLDVQRFGDATEVRALATAAELDEYTYLVAGCVGEFWTQICARHLRNFAGRRAEEMRNLGREYGKGLQLINILRDAGSDLRSGRCYLPEEELIAGGVAPNEILNEPARAQPVFEKWRRKAENAMVAGLEYACVINLSRVRFATALPALIGVRTLALLREAGPQALQRNVKIPRNEVRAIVSRVAITLASPRSLRKIFAQLSREENVTKNIGVAFL